MDSLMGKKPKCVVIELLLVRSVIGAKHQPSCKAKSYQPINGESLMMAPRYRRFRAWLGQGRAQGV
jgi:hypothetical protein